MGMICRDFERMWNELIDAGSPTFRRSEADEMGRPGSRTSDAIAMAACRESDLLDHAAHCPHCRQIVTRYQTLATAVRTWGPPPMAPAGLVDRILAAIPEPTAQPARVGAGIPWVGRFWRVGLPMATAAACVAAAISFGLVSRPAIDPAGHAQNGSSVAQLPVEGGDRDAAGGQILHSALTDATDATWDLARAASEPAARISRQVFDAATSPEHTPAQPDVALEAASDPVAGLSLYALTPDSDAAVAALQQVGDHLASGVRPLSSTALQAFSFLLAPARPKPEVRAQPPAARGA